MFKLSRLLIAYAIAAVLALILGYLVSFPSNLTFAVLALLLLVFSSPLLLKWHHVLLIFFWNSVFTAEFMPGSPRFWLICGLFSFGVAALNNIVFQRRFLRAPELTRALVFFAVVVFAVAWYRGGIGIRVFGGSSIGGRYYLFIFGAIAGYFAFTSEVIPPAKGTKMAEVFMASGTSSIISNIAFTIGPAFYFLYYIVPSEIAVDQAVGEAGLTESVRISGLAPFSYALFSFLLGRYGLRGLFDWTKPWRLLFLFGTLSLSFFAGFRAGIIQLVLLFVFQFYVEGLLRTRFLPIIMALGLVGLAPVLIWSRSMPTSMQRALSFLPVNVDSAVLEDAKTSSQWRFDMWTEVARDIPKYFFIGKGYGVDPNELYVVRLATSLGQSTSPYESQILTGDYHSGPLSAFIPFGVFGFIGFLWILAAGFKVLSLNRRYGDARLRRANNTLLALYLTHCVTYFFVFGALYDDLAVFLGILGFSVSLNGGVRRKTPARRAVAQPPERQKLAMEPG